jgi:hypothetical protein
VPVFYVVWLVVYVGGLLPRGFRRKRACLLPDEDDADGRNAYRSERALFEALGRGRPTERPLDYILGAALTALLVLAAPLLGLLAGLPFYGDAEDVPVGLMFAGYIPAIVAAVWLWRAWRQRVWR